jgi:prepilin-type processing-associated H-X9-DG protein
VFRDEHHPDWLRLVTNLSPEDFLKVLANSACAIGNSSSFVRDAGFFGTPVVLVGVGDRQLGREWDEHVVHVPAQNDQIFAAARRQLTRGRYGASMLYGDGHVSERITTALATAELYVQKRLHYGPEALQEAQR